MHLQQWSGAGAATWIVAAGLIGLVSNVTSIGGAAVVLGVGLVPPILLMWHWSTALPERISIPIRHR
jgi:hypothetical protein